MTKKERNQLEKKWHRVISNFEDKIENVAFIGDGLLFILFLPVWFILKTIQWLSWIVGYWIIRKIPTTE